MLPPARLSSNRPTHYGLRGCVNAFHLSGVLEIPLSSCLTCEFAKDYATGIQSWQSGMEKNPWLAGGPRRRLRTTIVPGFLRSSGAESACRTQTGRPGSRMCRAFAVRRGKNGVPPANRTTRTPTGPIKHNRIGTRDCDSSILSAFTPAGTSNPRECRQFRKRHLRISRKSPARPRAGTSNPRECCGFAKLHLRICRKFPPRARSVTSLPR